MTTVKGIYENGRIKLSEKVSFKTSKNVLITFLEEEKPNEDEHLRSFSLTHPDIFLKEYLKDECEDLYQDYVEKIKK